MGGAGGVAGGAGGAVFGGAGGGGAVFGGAGGGGGGAGLLPSSPMISERRRGWFPLKESEMVRIRLDRLPESVPLQGQSHP